MAFAGCWGTITRLAELSSSTHICASSFIASFPGARGGRGSAWYTLFALRLISQNTGKIVYLQDALCILLASDIDGCHRSKIYRAHKRFVGLAG